MLFTCDIAVNHFWWLTALFSYIKTLSCLHSVPPSIGCFHPCKAELDLQSSRTGTQGAEPSIQLTTQACTVTPGTQLAHPSNALLTPLSASPAPSAPGKPQCLSTTGFDAFLQLAFPGVIFFKRVLWVYWRCCEHQVYGNAVSCR